MVIVTSGLRRDAAAVDAFDGRATTDLSGEDLDAFVVVVSEAKRQIDVLMAIGAAEVVRRDRAGGGFSRRRGHAGARRQVADQLGGSESEAEKLIQVGLVLENAQNSEQAGGTESSSSGSESEGSSSGQGSDSEQGSQSRQEVPVWALVAAAVRAGTLSTDKAEVIVRTLEAVGDRAHAGLEQELVEMGLRLSLRDLKRAVDAALAELDRKALAAKQAAQREQRSLRIWEGRDGLTRLSGVLDPETAAPVKALIEAYVRDQFAARRDQDPAMADTRTAMQMNADALAVMATHLLGCAQPAVRAATTVVVRADRRELAAELGIGECDQLHTPLSGHAMRRMACAAGLMPVLADGKSLPVDYGRVRELFTREQRLAMHERDGGCARCHAPPSWCEAHHVVPRSRNGPTDLANGAMLCTRCHHDVHRDGWEIDLRRVIGSDGEVEDQIWFIPPATVDPARVPRLGGRAALRIRGIRRDPPFAAGRGSEESGQVA